MYPLQRIFKSLNDSEYCSYTQNAQYPITQEDGNIAFIQARELLEMSNTSPREHVMLAYFGDAPTRVRYTGENTALMRKTIHDLRLPHRIPENLAEKVFYLFDGELKKFSSGPLSLEQLIVPGKEHHFSFFFKKLLTVYKISMPLLEKEHSQEELAADLDTLYVR